MGLDLFNKQVLDTYDAIIKVGDNNTLTGTPKRLSDGRGNDAPIYLGTSTMGIGITPSSGVTFEVNGLTKLTSVNITGSITNGVTIVGQTVTDSLKFTGGTGTQGTLSWNTDEETVDLINNGAVLQLGQEVHVHVRNNSVTNAIPNGTPVYVAGTLGASGRLKVAPMIADGSIAPEYFIGVTTEDIEAGGDGKVTWFGKVRGFNTLGYAEGSKLYVSETVAGGWQTTHPVAPNPKLEVAFTVNQKSNGTIFVRGENGHYLTDTHDINITSVADKDLLVYDSALGIWKNSKTLGNITTGTISSGNITTSGYLRGPATFVIDPAAHGDDTGEVVIAGNLRVDGETTTVNSNTVTVKDKNVVLGSGATADTDNDGAGITVLRPTIGSTASYIQWNEGTDQWDFSNDINANLKGNADTATSANSATSAGKWTTARTLTIGDTSKSVDGSGNVSWTKAEIGITKANIDALNVNADTLDTKHATDFTLDYVTTNGSSTANSVTFGDLNANSLSIGGILKIDSNGDFQISGFDFTSAITVKDDTTGYPLKLYGVNTTIGSISTELQFYSGYDGGWYIENQTGSTYGASVIRILGREVEYGGIELTYNNTLIGGFYGDGIDLNNNTSITGTLNVNSTTTLSGTTNLYYTQLKDSLLVLDPNGSSYSTAIYRDGVNPHVLMAGGGTSTQWNTAYSYSQVGHLPLAGGTLSGGLTLDYAAPTIILYDPNSSTGSYPQVRFNTANNQGVKLVHNEFDGELPASGYGLVLTGDDSNSQFPTTGTLSFVVHGEIFTGGTTNGTVNKVLHAGNYSSYITTSYINGLNVNADTLDGYHLVEATGNNGVTWGGVPFIKSDGVMEVGRYLDFHHTSASGTDYAARLHTDGGTSGTLFINGDKILDSGNFTTFTDPKYLRSDTSDTMSGSLSISGGNGLYFTAANSRIYSNGYRMLEGNTTGTLLQLGENYTTTRLYGNVGIDKSAPDSRLHIHKAADSPVLLTLENYVADIDGDGGVHGNFIDFKTSDGNVTSQPQARIGMLVKDYTGENGISSEGDGNLVFYTNDGTDDLGNGTLSEVMRITHQKRVGINTDNPDYALHAYSQTTNVVGQFESGDNQAWISVRDNNYTTYGAMLGCDYSAGLNIILADNGANKRLVIDNSGNVGIGTTSPSSKLDINGATNSKGLRISGLHSFGASSSQSIELNMASTSYSAIRAFQGSDWTGVIHSFGRSWSGGVSVGMMNIEGYAGVSLGTWNSPTATFLSSGNVGIGTTSPEEKLHVNGIIKAEGTIKIDDGATGNPYLALYQNGSEKAYMQYVDAGDRLIIQSDGVIDMFTGASQRMRIDSSGNVNFLSGDVSIINTKTLRFNGSSDNTYAIGYDSGIDGVKVRGLNGLVFQTGTGAGTERMRIDSSGRVGIGTTSPETNLDVVGIVQSYTNAGDYARLGSNTNGGYVQGYGGAAENFLIRGYASSGVQAYFNAGNIGIGCTDPQTNLEIRGAAPYLTISNTTEDDAGIYFNDYQAGANPASSSQAAAIKFNSSNNQLSFYNNDANNAALIIGTDSISYFQGSIYTITGSVANLSIRLGDDNTGFYDSGSNTIGVVCNGSLKYNFEADGTFRAAADIVAYYSFSDARLKTNVKPLENSLEKVKQLQGVSYEWIDGERKGRTEVGLIAQEVEKVVPEVVREQKRLGDDTEYKTVDYEKLVGVLIEAIKEQQEQIDELKRRLDGSTN